MTEDYRIPVLPSQTKVELRELLHFYLYERVEEHRKEQLESLIKANCTLSNSSFPAFRFRGATYQVNAFVGYQAYPRQLHPGLIPVVEKFVAEQEQLLEYEQPMVRGYITAVLNSSNSLKDYLRLLPASVHLALADITMPDLPATLSESDIDSMNVRYAQHISLLKQRLLLNLLF